MRSETDEKLADTGANWNVQEQFHVPKRRGIVLDPEQVTVDPSAVINRMPEDLPEVGDGKTDIEAPGSTRKRRLESSS